MYNKEQGCQLSSPSMGPIHAYPEIYPKKPLDTRNNTPQLKPLQHLQENLKSGVNDDEDDQFQGDSCPSDSESGITGPGNGQPVQLNENGLIRIGGGEVIYEAIEKKLASTFGLCGFNVKVEAIHRIDYSGIMSQAKLHSFCVYSRAVEMNRGGNANVKYGWYASTKNEINTIISNGFGVPTNGRTHGQGIYLSPADCPTESLRSVVSDEDGISHVLICRVIMGKSEIIHPGSGQSNPSCEDFDSGVDDLVRPKKYIVWGSRVNTHILPEFVVSFRTSSYSIGHQRGSQPRRKPNSEWLPFNALTTVLSKHLPPDAIELITKDHNDYLSKKIKREEMVRRVRLIVGDRLLMAIIQRYGGK